MKNKTLTKKMKAQLVELVLNQIITQECMQAKQEASTIVLNGYYLKYGFPGSAQLAALENLPEAAMPRVAVLPIIIQMKDNTAIERSVLLTVAVPFADGMLPVVIKEDDIVPLLTAIKEEEKDTSEVKEIVEKAVDSMPGTFKAIQVWPELQPFIIGLFYQTQEEQRDGVPEEIIAAKNAIEKLLQEKEDEEKPESTFDELEGLAKESMDQQDEAEDTN